MTSTRLGRSLSILSGLSAAQDEEKYRLLSDNLEQAVLFVSLPELQVTDANLRVMQVTGYSRRELEFTSLPELMFPANEGSLSEVLCSVKVGVTRRFGGFSLRTHGGDTVPVNVIATRGSERPKTMLLILELEKEVSDETNIRTGDNERSLHAMAVLLEMLRSPLTSVLSDAVPLCKTFLDADEVALYSEFTANTEPGFQILDAVGSRTLPEKLDDTDGAVGPALFEWRADMPAVSDLSRSVRDQGFELLLTHPLGDRIARCGVLVALYRSGNRAAGRGRARMEPAARIITVLIELQSRLEMARELSYQQEALERQWHTLLHSVGDGVLTVNADGEIEHINAHAERMLGYKQTEVSGMQLRDVLVGAQPAAGALLSALSKGEEYAGSDITLVRRDGQEVHVLLRGVPIDGTRDGDLSGLITIRDHSERKAMEAKAQHLEQRAFVGDLSAIFAHEIRNPLNGITTGLQYIQMQLGSEDAIQESVQSILDEASRISRLLQDILLIVKPTELVIKPTLVGQLVRTISDRWRERLHSRGISMDVEVDEDTPLVLADVDQIEQVFSNLLSNAMHAMEPVGGSVTITVQSASSESDVRGEHVEINIGDTGPGMPGDVLERVFNPFYTTKQEGTGLGLAISQRIVNDHRGTLSAQSWPTIGTVFTVVLPATTSAGK